MSDPRGATITYGRVEADEVDEAVVTLARAFYPDPLFGFFARGRHHEYHQLEHVFAAFTAADR
jgi:hypothetical protein